MIPMTLLEKILTIIGTLAGVVLGYVLSWLDEWRKRSKVSFELEKEVFEQSVRVSVLVRNEGSHYTINNAVCSVDIEAPSLEDIAVPKEEKDGRKCSYANFKRAKCSGLDYLADPRVGVKHELLPWAVPIPAGTGLDGLAYCHLATIPAKSGI